MSSEKKKKKDGVPTHPYGLVPKKIADEIFDSGRYASVIKKW